MNKSFDHKWAPRSVQDVQDFVERHGNSLSEVLHRFGGNVGLDLFCDAKRLLECLDPDPAQIGIAVRKMFVVLEQADGQGLYHDAALRWHGARLYDLAARLPA
tara:strand:+ start:1128 stop:1436 length:309 start_codon:yes stop_codon:yes gene_type:complete